MQAQKEKELPLRKRTMGIIWVTIWRPESTSELSSLDTCARQWRCKKFGLENAKVASVYNQLFALGGGKAKKSSLIRNTNLKTNFPISYLEIKATQSYPQQITNMSLIINQANSKETEYGLSTFRGVNNVPESVYTPIFLFSEMKNIQFYQTYKRGLRSQDSFHPQLKVNC